MIIVLVITKEKLLDTAFNQEDWKLVIWLISAGYFFSPDGKFFSAQIWKRTECHFWADVILRQPNFQASRAFCAQKLRFLRVVLFQKLFKVFCFLGHSVGRYGFEWNKFDEKAQCVAVCRITNVAPMLEPSDFNTMCCCGRATQPPRTRFCGIQLGMIKTGNYTLVYYCLFI